MKVFMIAGEASGDGLGGPLMAALRGLDPDVRFGGVGGVRMAEQGLISMFPMGELSVMGLAEIVPRYPALRRRMLQCVEAILDQKPDVVITIDSPDFMQAVVTRVRKRAPGIRLVHYGAPTVWAWRRGRACRLARRIDQLLALFPFEPPYFTRHSLRCDFVGHPAADRAQPDAAQVRTFRAAIGVGDARIILVVPGSRRGEITRLLPIFRKACDALITRHPDVRLVLPVAPGMITQVTEGVQNWSHRPVLVMPNDHASAFAAAEGALAASGSVSLELAMADTAMVIGWRAHPLTEAVLRRMVQTDTVTLVNLISGTRAVPEFLGPAFMPEALADAISDVMAAPNAQAEALAITRRALRMEGGAAMAAARAVLDGMARG